MELPDNNILDIIISLVLIYALLSVLVSILLEWWNNRTKARAAVLQESINRILNDSLNINFGDLFYNHYLIAGLSNPEKRPPQYVSSKMFAEVLIDVIANRALHLQPVETIITAEGKQFKLGNAIPDKVLDRFKFSLEKLKPSPLIDTFQSFYSKAGGDYTALKQLIAEWYDDYQDRVTGLYKYRQRNKLLVFGFTVAIVLNVDSLHLVKMLSLDDNLRNNLVRTAEKVADQYNSLADSSRQKTVELEKVIHQVLPDSAIRNKDGLLKRDLKKKLLSYQLKDSVALRLLKTADSLLLSDSSSLEYKQRLSRMLNVTTSLNIPIGWDEGSAPLSWINKKQSSLGIHPPGVNTNNQATLFEYIDRRNSRTLWNGLFWAIGILISGVSLSFGAPFWFETLVKLINIRRAGKKPEPVNTK